MPGEATRDENTRTTITLPRDLLRRLKVEAAQRGTSMNRVICQALEEHVDAREHSNERPPKPQSLGVFDSGHTDTASLASDLQFEPPAWR